MGKEDITLWKKKLDEVFLYLDLGFRPYYIDCSSGYFVIEAENYLRTGMRQIVPANQYNDREIANLRSDLGIFLINQHGISNTGLNSFVLDFTDCLAEALGVKRTKK